MKRIALLVFDGCLGSIVIFLLTLSASAFAGAKNGIDTALGVTLLIMASLICLLMWYVWKKDHKDKQSNLNKNYGREKLNQVELSEYEFQEDSVKVNGQYKMCYKDFDGNVTKRKISNVHVNNAHYFEAYCHLREDVRTFTFGRVVSIIDLQTNEQNENALEVFSKNADEDIGNKFNVDVTKRQLEVKEHFDTSGNSNAGTRIPGEYDFTYTNSDTNVTGTYRISEVSIGISRMHGQINYTQNRESVSLKKVSEIIDCETGEVIKENFLEYLRSKVKK